jgi:hypothetical protein
MGLSFKVAPGVRIRASSRGLSAGIGPRAVRVHVGSRGVGVSSGVGSISGYTHLGGGAWRATSDGRRSSGGPTKASIATHERELRVAQREADIEKVAALEASLVNLHQQSYPKAQQIELPPAEEVDPEPIKNHLEEAAGIPTIVTELGGGEQAPAAAEPEPVDRYELMREHRKQARQGISIFKVRDRLDAARDADRRAEAAAAVETERRQEARHAEQVRLDEMWAKLEEARESVAKLLPGEIKAEKKRHEAERDNAQRDLDAEWAKLIANDPMTTIAVLEQAFADNEAPAAPIDCDGERTTVVMQFSPPETVVPERKPARTPGGKRTLKKRTKTETNALYLEALGSNVLATVKEAFAVAPGTKVAQILVIRHETDKKYAGELAAIYVGEFDRDRYDTSNHGNPASTLVSAPEAVLSLKGKTEQVSPIDLSERPDLQEVLAQVTSGLKD